MRKTAQRFRHIRGPGHTIADWDSGDEVCRVAGLNADQRATALAKVLSAHADDYDRAIEEATE